LRKNLKLVFDPFIETFVNIKSAGIPVITIEGRGYSLIDGYTVAPVQFTEKQANALITAQHLVNQSNNSSFVHIFEDVKIYKK